MKRMSILWLLSVLLLPGELFATQTTYTLTGTNYTVTPGSSNVFAGTSYVNNGNAVLPDIDAVNFVNYGTFTAVSLNSAQPYETSSTLNFTNYGTMVGAVGWLFDDAPNSMGYRQPSANFFNGNGALVQAQEFSFIGGVAGLANVLNVVSPSYLVISATNVINQGQLEVGANGLLQMTGGDVKLSRSVLNVLSVPDEAAQGVGSQQPVNTNFFSPDLAVYDVYWGQTNMSRAFANLLNINTLWNGSRVSYPDEPVLSLSGQGRSVSGSFTALISGPGGFTNTDSIINVDPSSLQFVVLTNKDLINTTTNGPIYTNATKTAIFLNPPQGFSMDWGYTLGQSNFYTIQVLFTQPSTNVITGSVTPNYVYVSDTLASDPNRGYLINILSGTARPTNYIVDRINHSLGDRSTNGPPDPAFFLKSGNQIYNPTNLQIDTVTNFFVSGDYSAYSPYFDVVASRPPAVVGGTITNLPGSIWIDANNLDLDRTGLRANGLVSISAKHLISSTNAVIDCPNLMFNVGSTNGSLSFQNLAAAGIGRFSGQFYVWSATWSNVVMQIYTNNFAPMVTSDGNGGNITNPVPAPITNFFTINWDVLVVDGSGVQLVQPVFVYDLLLHAGSITLNDPVTVLESLLLDCKSFTLQNALRIPGAFPAANPIANTALPATPLTDWTATNAPSLQFFTNNGTLNVANVAHFGDDRPPYATFVNNNSAIITVGGLHINSSYLENDGTLASSGGAMFLQCGIGKFQNSSVSAANICQFNANNLKFANSSLTINNSLNFFVTNSLSDAGPSAPNSITVQNGLNLLLKPATGDMLGSSFVSLDASTTGSSISHTWAGEDRGPCAAGFTNNAALGRLILSPSGGGNSLFRFTGAGQHNGLYVDVLDLTGLGSNALSELQIDPNITIYYGAAKLGFTPPTTNGVQMEPEEYLDGQFSGHLRWAQSFAGPNSAVDVIVTNASGQQVQVSVNAALRNSKIIDSNGNGLANGFDPMPFNAATISLQVLGAGSVLPDYSGQLLLLGVSYGMTAQPADGFSFMGWTGTFNTPSTTVNFVMTNGLTFVANFNSSATPGSYSGLFFEPSPAGVEFQRSGAVAINTSKGGKYSGSLRLANTKYSFSGMLQNGVATNQVSTPSGPLTVQFQIGSKEVDGSVTATNWTADLLAVRSTFNSRTNPAPFAGKYTILFAGSGDSANTNVPFGSGYGSINVSTAGKIQFSGVLADGTHVAQSSIVAADGSWPFYVPLYGGQGQILSWMNFGSFAGFDVAGMFSWIKPTNAMSRLYPAGFNFQTNAFGSLFSKSLVPVTGFSSGVVELLGGNLTQPIFQGVNIDDKNKVTPVNNARFKLTVSPSSGFFNGSTTNSEGKTVSFHGAILQNQAFGGGYFLGSTESGNVFFGSPQ